MKTSGDFKLRTTFSLWLCPHPDEKQNYADLLKKIGNFSTGSEFWSYQQYIQRPEQLPDGFQILVFPDSIKPVWEDKANKNGGRFIVRVRRPSGNQIWEELLFNYIGELSKDCEGISGLIMHVKHSFILISIWIGDYEKQPGMYERIQAWINNTLVLNKSSIEFLPHPREGEEFQQQQQTK